MSDLDTAAIEATLRNLAVQTVDDSCGYTMEFSGNPAGHRQMYDLTEERLREAILPIAAALSEARSRIAKFESAIHDVLRRCDAAPNSGGNGLLAEILRAALNPAAKETKT